MTPAPMRIQRRRTKGWRLPPNTVVVSRPGPWGNPYAVGDILRSGPYAREVVATKQRAVQLFEEWARNALDGNALPDANGHTPTAQEANAALKELRGQNLACWCKLCDNHKDGKPFDVHCDDCEPCHADHLGKVANG